jgi:hypothetical protein
MDRQNLIQSLVARKLQAAGRGKNFCVPCFGRAQTFCIPAAGTKARYLPAAQPKQ